MIDTIGLVLGGLAFLGLVLVFVAWRTLHRKDDAPSGEPEGAQPLAQRPIWRPK